MFPKPSQWQGSSRAAQRHWKQPGSEGLPETKSNVPMTAMGMAWTHTNPEQTTASHTSTYRLFLIYLSQAELQAPAWYRAVMHCRYLCACFTLVWISTGPSKPQAGRPGCTMQEKKGRPLPSLQSTLQLEGCLKNSILPQPLPKTTRVKRIYISKLSPSFFILFLHVLISLIYFNLETAWVTSCVCPFPWVSSTVHKFSHSTWIPHKQTAWKLGPTQTDPEPLPNSLWYAALWLLEDEHCGTENFSFKIPTSFLLIMNFSHSKRFSLLFFFST